MNWGGSDRFKQLHTDWSSQKDINGYSGLNELEMMNEVLRVLILSLSLSLSQHSEVTAAVCAATGFAYTVVLWSGFLWKYILIFI